MIRFAFAVIAALFGGGLVVGAVENLGHRLWPPPAGVQPTDPQQIAALLHTMPTGAKLFVILAWCAGSFTGGLIAGRLAPGRAGLTFGIVQTCLIALNVALIPHPWWMALAGVAQGIPLAWAGQRVSERAQGL